MWKQIIGVTVVGIILAGLFLYGLVKESERFEEHGAIYSSDIPDL